MAGARSNKTKNKKEPSAIEKKLLECAISRKPVLLYGKRINEVIDFVKNISERMSREWKSLNFYSSDGEDFFNQFTKFHKAAQFLEDRHWSRLRCADNLFCTIFIDNLHYYSEKEGEEAYYNKAGKIISKNMLSYIGYPVPSAPNKYSVDNVDSAVEAAAAIAAAAYADAYPDDDKEEEDIATVYHVDWIVAYTDKSDTFPSYFRNQFEEISLDSESDEGEQQEGNVSKKKSKLKRGEKQRNIPDDAFIPFVKKNLLYLRSPSGGKLNGKELQKKIQQDIEIRFKKYGDKATLGLGTIRNLISDIDTGKADKKKNR